MHYLEFVDTSLKNTFDTLFEGCNITMSLEDRNDVENVLSYVLMGYIGSIPEWTVRYLHLMHTTIAKHSAWTWTDQLAYEFFEQYYDIPAILNEKYGIFKSTIMAREDIEDQLHKGIQRV